MRIFSPSKIAAFAITGIFTTLAAMAADPATGAVAFRERGIAEALGLMVLFAIVGVLSAVAGYRIFDKFTPGDLHKEIVENKNMAAAVIAGAAILGVCIIVAAAMIG